MQPLFDLIGKFLGAQWLWNLATLALLLQAYKAFDKLRRLPADPPSGPEFQKYKEGVDARFVLLESAQSLAAQRVGTLWKHAGFSDPARVRARAAGQTYSEIVEIVEPDPWPRRRATDRLLTPPALPVYDPRDEGRYARRGSDPGPGAGSGRSSDPGRRPPIPREDPYVPPSDRPFDSDPRDRDPEPFVEETPVPPRPKRR
jgi:hypothetical protein